MKKIFISILSAAVLAACAKSETEDIVPAAPGQEDEAQSVYVEIGVTAGSETKATYDENLQPYWEEGDQILAVQGLAVTSDDFFSSKEETISANNFDIKSGIGDKSAVFSGDISIQTTEARHFHFAYPASGTSLSTYGKKEGWSSDAQNTTTCTYTIPSEQDGKWTPFLCASTADNTTAANIESIAFGKTRNACLAVRVYEKDGTTPKKIKSITITAQNNIVGTMSATTDNDGSFDGMDFTSSGTGNEITADNLQDIEPLNGLYEYRFEVLPANAGVLTLKIVDENGSEVVRTTSAKAFTANKRSGVKVNWDAAGIKMDATTWFDDSCAKGFVASDLSSENTIYYEVSLFGIGVADIKEKGVIVYRKSSDGGITDRAEHPNTDASVKFKSEIPATAGDGCYYIQGYAVLNDGTEHKTSPQAVYIVPEKDLPAIQSHTIKSSYNNNGTVDKNNDINGDVIKANITLNGCYASNNLVESITFYHNGTPETINAGVEHTQTMNSLGAYDCYIKVTFMNGYSIQTPTYTINVTGIPYWWKNNPNGEKVNSGTTTEGTCNVYIPSDLSNVYLDYDINVHSATLKMTGTLKVNNNTIFSVTPSSNSDSRQTNHFYNMQISTGTINFLYENSSTGSMVAKGTIYKVGIKY